MRFRLSIPPPPNPLSFLLLLLGDFLLVIMQTDRQTLHSHTIVVFSLPSQPHFPPTIRGAVKHLFLSPFLFSLLGFSFPSTCSRRTDGRNINPKGKTTHSTQRGRTIPSIPLSGNRAPHTKSSKKLPGFLGGKENALLFPLSLMRWPFPSLPLATVPAATRAGEAAVIGMSDNLITTTVRRERRGPGGLNRWRHPSSETHPFLPSFPPLCRQP